MTDNPKKKIVTRTMKVTMSEEEFDKFDKGITHSDKGLRDDKGKLSALPDIESIPDNELSEDVSSNSSDKSIVLTALEFLNEHPEIVKIVVKAGAKVFSIIKNAVKNRKSKKQINTVQVETVVQSDNSVSASAVNNSQSNIVVNPEQFDQMISALRNKVQELTTMIYTLSNTIVLDDKTDDVYRLEQDYLKELASEESRKTMQSLIENKAFLPSETILLFSDYLNGYIRHDNELIPIPIETERN
jgi:hypothetical protein